MTLARSTFPPPADQDANWHLENCSYDQDANLHLETPARSSVSPLLHGSALNHAHQSAQTDAPPSDTTSLPGRPAEANQPMLSRRAFISASSSVALITVSSPALAQSEDPKFPTPECPPPALCSRPDLAVRLDAFAREWHWRWNLTNDASEEEIIAIEEQDSVFFEKEATLIREITEMRVQTLADVVLQARACALSNSPFWIDPFVIEHMHGGESITRSLVDGICKLHDIDPIPHGNSLPMDKEPIPSETASSVDPIFAAIEGHRIVLSEFLEHAGRDNGDNDDPAYEAKYLTLDEQAEEAATALANIQPTTMTGVLTLLAYIQEINIGGIKSRSSASSYSSCDDWPVSLVDDEIKGPRGRALELPFPYWVMENIRAAISEIRARERATTNQNSPAARLGAAA